MTSSTLIWGCTFLAFGPIASLLFGIVYQKAQLVIVVTTSAFSFLLSALAASLVLICFDAIGAIGTSPFVILIPSVMAQFIARCGFVALYHKVEQVIQVSIEHHEAMQATTNRNQDNNNSSDSALLRLELNDWACGLAAGVGFGGMHAVLLYGTLLASESGNLGTLYQEACPSMPGLLLSAWNALFFTILDVIWMLFTFFGMRRRALPGTMDFSMSGSGSGSGTGRGTYLGNSKQSGNMALVFVAVTHFAASFATTPNYFGGGCWVSLPLLAAIVASTVAAFYIGVVGIYLPTSSSRQSGDGMHSE
jgi:hypothetical protein